MRAAGAGRGGARLASAGALLGLALLLLTGCAAIQRARSNLPPPLGPPRLCTLMGCVSTFAVRFTEGTPPRRFEVTLTETDGETITFICQDGALDGYHSSRFGEDMTMPGSRGLTACVDDGFQVVEFTPQEVTIDVRWDDPALPTQGVLITMSPAYQITQPNGPGCPPVCRGTLIGFPLE